ncbi:hypothetical protein P3W53_25475 [Pseudomonas denitrificans (nom. rej.)]|nr:hypothetical protein [Pseudomonas denitrificans (nom. rej.)]
MSDEQFYELVAEELKRGNYISGLYAKAFSEAKGVKSHAEALYIKYRVAQLVEQHRSNMRNQARAKSQQKANAASREADATAKEDADHLTGAHYISLVLLFIVVSIIIFLSVRG